MRPKLLKIILAMLCAGMLSGCAMGTPVVATVDTEETQVESITGSEGVETGESTLGEAEQPLESEETAEGQTEALTDASSEESTEMPTEESTQGPPYLIRVDRVANCVTVYASDANGVCTGGGHCLATLTVSMHQESRGIFCFTRCRIPHHWRTS